MLPLFTDGSCVNETNLVSLMNLSLLIKILQEKHVYINVLSIF